jgi:hypothetical protein
MLDRSMEDTYAEVSVIPYPLIMGAMAVEINSCVSFAIGAAPFIQNLSLPPVASLIFLKTTASSTADPGSPFAKSNLLLSAT